MTVHKADRRSHSFAIVGVDGWDSFMEWMGENHPGFSHAFHLGPGNLPMVSKAERGAIKEAGDVHIRPRRVRQLSSSSTDSE